MRFIENTDDGIALFVFVALYLTVLRMNYVADFELCGSCNFGADDHFVKRVVVKQIARRERFAFEIIGRSTDESVTFVVVRH